MLVARAQNSTLQEVERTSNELADIGLNNQYLVINGCMAESEIDDPLAAAIYQRERQALQTMPESLRMLATDHTRLLPCNLVGLEALCSLLSGEDSQAGSWFDYTDGQGRSG